MGNPDTSCSFGPNRIHGIITNLLTREPWEILLGRKGSKINIDGSLFGIGSFLPVRQGSSLIVCKSVAVSTLCPQRGAHANKVDATVGLSWDVN